MTITADFRTRADWRAVEHLYQQLTAIVSTGERVPTEIAGSLANSLGRVMAFYEDNEERFLKDLLELWCSIDKLEGTPGEKFKNLYLDRRLDSYPAYTYPRADTTRRRPRPFEAAVETSRRLIDVNNVRHELANCQSGAILGGSVSYGRFYNVTGAAPEFGLRSSDTDLLLVLREYDQLPEIAARLGAVRGVDSASLDLLKSRAKTFPMVRSKDAPCIFSHKLKFWTTTPDPVLSGTDIPSQYSMSLHVFSLSDFDFVTLKDIPILEPSTGSSTFDRVLHDYRDSTSPVGAYHNLSFSNIAMGTNPLDPSEVEGGFVAKVQVCLIRDDRFCPGLHQNLILPQFEKRWESESVRLYLRLLTFRWKILERLRTERTKRPFEEQRLSLSHVRYFVFSPHITRRADRD
jgi:hypothetical protein